MLSGSKPELLLIARDCQPLDTRLIAQADSLLLTQDALYLLLQPDSERFLAQFMHCYALLADAEARNIDLPSKVSAIDYRQWVELSLLSKQVIRI